MKQKLTPVEREYLQKQHRKERDGRTRDRIKAVLAYDDGYSYSEIARILLLDDETIRRHIEDFFKRNKLNPEQGGSEGYLCQADAKLLISHLNERTYLYVKEICAYVENVFKKTYSISGMTKWLRANGFRYKKPHGVPAKSDASKQAEFIEQYEALKKTLPPDEAIFFMDSTHPAHQTRLAYGWIQKGLRKAEKMTACQKRVNVIGALNLQTLHVAYRQVDWVNASSIQDFLVQLMLDNPKAKKIHIILDNAGYHRSKEILALLKTSNIIFHYLPPYSPNLNAIERLWKIMHEQVTYNRYYEKFIDFKEGILNFFRNIGEYKSIIQSRINDNFQRLAS
jgi:transposase